MARNNGGDVTGWVGWVYFAGVMMVIAGVLQMINGLAALLNSSYFVVKSNTLLVFDYTQWGWIHLILGLVVLLAGMSVINGQLWGRVVGVFLALLGVIANFVFLAAYPIWSILAIIIYTLVIYALTVHGNELSA